VAIRFNSWLRCPGWVALAALLTICGCVNVERSSLDLSRPESEGWLLLLALGGAAASIAEPDESEDPVTPQRILLLEADGSANTAIIDLTTLEMEAGPATPANFGVNSMARAIQSGARSGQYWLLGSSTTTSFFDPPTESYAAGPGLDAFIGANANSWIVSSGTHADKIYVRFGQGWGGTDRYNPSTDLNEASAFASTGGSGSAGSHSFLVPSGTQAGERMILVGGITIGQLYDPVADSFAAGPAIGGTIGPGSHTMPLDAGTFLIPHGGAATTSSEYNPGSNTFPAGPALGCNCDAGCHSTRIDGGTNDGKFLLICGGSSNDVQIYDQAGAAFTAGPALTAPAGSGAQTIVLAAGDHAGMLWIIHGGSTSATSLYDPENNTMSAGPALPISPGGAAYVPLD